MTSLEGYDCQPVTDASNLDSRTNSVTGSGQRPRNPGSAMSDYTRTVRLGSCAVLAVGGSDQ